MKKKGLKPDKLIVKPTMKKVRLLGIELVRGISTYAVILVHSGDETWGLPTDFSAVVFRSYFYFAVPFFLATAFYFMTAKPEISYSKEFWRSRIERLVIPYIIWSFLFFVLRVIIFTLTKRSDRLQQLLSDPLSVLFLGGASYHLYFLPLLLAGTSLILLLPLLQRLKIGRQGLVALSILSLFLYYLLNASGNSFQLGKNIAFQGLIDLWQLNISQTSLIRVFLVEIAWIVRCLPYFFIALTLNYWFKDRRLPDGRSSIVGWAVLFLMINVLGKVFLPGPVQEVLLAYSLFLLSISVSSYIQNDTISKLSISVGACSFGIYLAHPIIMNIVKPIVGKVFPGITASVSIYSMLILSISCFLISWLAVVWISQNKQIARYLWGG